jgi:hypothetical protein
MPSVGTHNKQVSPDGEGKGGCGEAGARESIDPDSEQVSLGKNRRRECRDTECGKKEYGIQRLLDAVFRSGSLNRASRMHLAILLEML